MHIIYTIIEFIFTNNGLKIMTIVIDFILTLFMHENYNRAEI